MIRPHRWLVVEVLAATLLATHVAAQGTEIVRGKVTDGDHHPVPEAEVTIIGMSTQATTTTRTNDKGVYTAVFANAEGDYLVAVRKIGYGVARKRATRTGLSSVVIADISLSARAVELDTLKVTASAPRRPSDSPIGGTDQDMLLGALFSLDPTDLVKLAGQVPGVLAIGDSAFSVLGAPSDQNSSTVDGLNFGGGNLPSDAVSSSRLRTTSTDPRNGRFAGGQTATVLRGGSDIFTAVTRGSISDKTLTWTDPDWPSPIPQLLTFSGGVGGPIVKRKLHYQMSWNAVNNTANPYSLLDPPPSLLSQYGLSRDSISALTEALRGLGVPLTAPGASDTRTQQSWNTATVIDYAPHATSSVRLIHTMFHQSLNAPGNAPFGYPSLGTAGSTTFQFAGLRMTGYLHGFLDELSASLNYGSGNYGPSLQSPTGSVRVGTQFDDGRTGLTSVRFGGLSNPSQRQSYDWDVQHEFSWISSDGHHRAKVGQDLDYETARIFATGDQYGNYSYQTLADLATNHPATYTRTLGSVQRSSHGGALGAWVGDEWVVSSALQLQGGLRLDHAFPGTIPDYNPDVATEFRLNTDQIPHTSFVTPRLGFSWTSAARRTSPGAASFPTGGLLAGMTPEALRDLLGASTGATPPGIAINGSFGGYGGTLDNGSLASLVDQTGLPNTRHLLSCVGAAVPIPVWGAIAAPAPSTCADGTGSTAFAVNQPSVRVYDPSFQVPITWRGSLGIDGIRLPNRWTIAALGFASYGTNNESAFDRNLRRAPAFTLPFEANRPVFAAADAIVPATGAIAPGAYRIDPAFGPVLDVVSDLHTETQQLQVVLAPPRPLFHGKLGLNLTYVLTHGTQQIRGIGSVSSLLGGTPASTGGDPFTREDVRGNQPTHQLVINLATRLWWFNTTARINLYSGFPYTPVVSGDINGDGRSNDRAFVSDPSSTPDTVLAAEMRQLLAQAPGSARDCLMRTAGTIAGYNSCSSGTQMRLDLNVQFVPPRDVGLGDRLHITMTMLNTSGALVRLFGLENTPLGRGALSTQVDNRLLYVTGFDPVTQRFRYQVNQLFGEPVNLGASRQRYPPFQLQLGVEYKLGGPQRAPIARALGLMPEGKQAPFSLPQLRDRLWQLARNPIEPILQRADSIGLGTDQIAALLAISKQLHAHVDSALAPIMAYLAASGRSVDDNKLMSQLGKARPRIAQMMLDAAAEAREVLTPAQRALLPAPPRATNAGKPRGEL